jgi:hypothetical protein
MRLFLTEIYAVSRVSGNVERFDGPDVQAISILDAERILDSRGLGYCKVASEAVEVIDMPATGNIIKQKPKYN